MSESPIPDGEQRRLQDLLVSGEQLAQIGTWEWLPPAQELFWSQNLYRIFGLEPGEVQPTWDLFMSMAHPDDRERLVRNARALAERDAPVSVDFRIPRVLGVTQDLTDVRDVLAGWGSALECTAGIFWVPAGDVLEPRVLVGEQIIRSVAQLDEVGRLVRDSHERWDGGGYPDRLSDEQIPLASRIVFCADSFHAIRSDHPYRRGRSAQHALEEIAGAQDSQLDPEVVEALIRAAGRLRTIVRSGAAGMTTTLRSRRLVELLV